MIIQPKTRGFICTTAHPVGCAKNVEEQVLYAKARPVSSGPKNALVIGSSTGYGLACRIAAGFCCGADTVGVFFERPASGNRTATPGWYNNEAFERLARAEGRIAQSVNGDAFSDEVKEQTLALIRSQLPGGKVDLVIYSLAAPKRTDPATGRAHYSVIKPVGASYANKTVDFHTGEVIEAVIPPAQDKEIEDTVAVMGGADWLRWMKALAEADVLSQGALTAAFSYIGPELTHAIYKNGSIGKAKEDLEAKSREIDALLAPIGGKSFVCVNKALVTQASAAIPVVPLYMALLFKAMKARGTHEDCIMQMTRMFAGRLYSADSSGDWTKIPVDEAGRIRMDDWEMAPEVQKEIQDAWPAVATQTVESVTDLAGFREDFFRLFGFGVPGVDYSADVNP